MNLAETAAAAESKITQKESIFDPYPQFWIYPNPKFELQFYT